jgi:hypothetical protein
MLLQNFGKGWVDKFETRLHDILQLFPNATVTRTFHRHGMLGIQFSTLDTTEQYVLDCVSHKLERESAKVCEHCGKYGFIRRDERLVHRQVLCLPCYALELSTRDELNAEESSTTENV